MRCHNRYDRLMLSHDEAIEERRDFMCDAITVTRFIMTCHKMLLLWTRSAAASCAMSQP